MAVNSRNKSKNQEYIRVVKSALSGFERAALISVTAAAYKAAVKATWQDSGRAAHNWQMAKGTDAHIGVDWTLDADPVGKKGDNRSLTGEADRVIKNRMGAYGISDADNPTTSSKIQEWVGNPLEETKYGIFSGYKAANTRKITIYNPIGTPEQRAYPFRAFLLHKSVSEAINLAKEQQMTFMRGFLNKRYLPRDAIRAVMRTFYNK